MEIYFIPLIGVVFLLCMPCDLLFTFGNLRNSLWAHSPELDLYRRTQITIILVLVTCILGICVVWVFVNFSVYRGGVTSLEPVIPSPLCLQLCSLSNVWTNAHLGTQQPPQCIIGFSHSMSRVTKKQVPRAAAKQLDNCSHTVHLCLSFLSRVETFLMVLPTECQGEWAAVVHNCQKLSCPFSVVLLHSYLNVCAVFS